MLTVKETIRTLYPINLIEGEGLGTAYEYYVKIKKLQKFINSIEKPKRILIAGLPERYGLSMDFFLIGQLLQAETVVIDERTEVLERAKEALRAIKTKRILDHNQVMFVRVNSAFEFDSPGLMGKKFDLALSSEVLQRLGSGIGAYISSLKVLAKSFALFAPNKGNESHANISGLKGISLEELSDHCQRSNSGVSIYELGYLDLPPFPPGLGRSKEKREKASKSRLEASFMKGLEIYSRCEYFLPTSIKRKKAHIVYIMAKYA